MNQEPADLLTFLVAILTLVTSREVATLVSPYAAIMVAASAGATLALSGKEETLTWSRGLVYLLVRILLAVTITVTLAELLQLVFPQMKPRYTLIPLALGIGWIRDYDQIRAWFGEMIDRFTKKRIDNGK